MGGDPVKRLEDLEVLDVVATHHSTVRRRAPTKWTPRRPSPWACPSHR